MCRVSNVSVTRHAERQLKEKVNIIARRREVTRTAAHTNKSGSSVRSSAFGSSEVFGKETPF